MAISFVDIDNKEKTFIDTSNILEFIYPIGSIYTSTSDIPPEELYANVKQSDTWKWEKLQGYLYADSGDKQVLDQMNSLDNGMKGKKYEPIKINTNNLPPHSHGMLHKHNRGSMNITGTINRIQSERGQSNNAPTGAFTVSNYNGYSDGGAGHDRALNLNFDASRSWVGFTSDPLETIGSTKNQTDTTGGGKSINWLPPTIVVYCWRRIA